MPNDLDTSTTSDLVSAAQAAKIVGCNRATITRWASSGILPTAVKAPGRLGTRLFDRSDVDRLAQHHRTNTSVEAVA